MKPILITAVASAVIFSGIVIGVMSLHDIHPESQRVTEDEQKSYFQKYWNDQIKLYSDEYVISAKKAIAHSYNEDEPLIEINGLQSKYVTDESIIFEIIAIGNGNGCISFDVTIRGEDENAPPVYSQGYVSRCDTSKKDVGVPLYFAINSENDQITNLGSGKYEVMASYYQNRAS